LAANRGLKFESYADLWGWSVTDLDSFWWSLWEYYEIGASRQPDSVLEDRIMPGTKWFPGAELNYSENFFSRNPLDGLAIIFKDEVQPAVELTWADIFEQTSRLANALRQLGIKKGDTVVAYMPHIPETIIALFAVASIGAIWSSCSPDFGSVSVLDRFQQIEPKVLIAVDGYRYNGKKYDRMEILEELHLGLPTLIRTILVPLINVKKKPAGLKNVTLWQDFLDKDKSAGSIEFEQVSFNHPLWVLYSSGTTGLPKPIVQSHGGILLEHFKMASLHLDLGPGDRFFWYTSTGWMMWNFLVGGLLTGATIVVYDGAPGYPDLYSLWDLASKVGITYFGTSAAFIHGCMKAGIEPSKRANLSQIRAVGSTGSPLSQQGFKWVYEHIGEGLALESVSGGTDLCTAFVGGCRLLPVFAGEIQCATLGAKVQAFDDEGRAVVGEVGELVISEPMPSMPLFFWGDTNNTLYRASYFDVFPGIWRHGDWIELTERGSCIIYGRSDSTINRQGVRLGTSEIYRVVETIPDVADSLVVDLELLGRDPFMLLFVVVKQGIQFDDLLVTRIKQKIKEDISPRHVPNVVLQIKEVPYTLSGKKMEVPVRRILLGQALERSVNLGAMRNPEAIEYFIQLAPSLQQEK